VSVTSDERVAGYSLAHEGRVGCSFATDAIGETGAGEALGAGTGAGGTPGLETIMGKRGGSIAPSAIVA